MLGIEFNTDQVHAIYSIENWWDTQKSQVYELAGGAGTGKTTLIRYLIERIGLDIYEDVLFLAFMGKAASQMNRNGLPAQTIHSAIYKYKKVADRDEYGHIIFDSRGRVVTKGVFELRDSDYFEQKKYKLIVLDEAGMVSEQIAKDLLSFGLPIITLGDLNQLPPVFGSPYFMRHPDYVLRQIMRQSENDPIVWLANQVLDGKKIPFGVYGTSAVIPKSDLNEYLYNNADVVLTTTNKLRHEVNQMFRKHIKNIKQLEMPHVGEKIICRKNNWDRSIDDYIYLTNGTAGFIDNIDKETFNGKKIRIDFRPDFLNKKFKNLDIDYKMLYAAPGTKESGLQTLFNKFEFAYAITVHLSQGSQYPNVLFLDEKIGNIEFMRRLEYTAITRAMKSITIAI